MAWEQCVLTLNNKELLHAAINRFLGRANDGSVDPEAHRKVKTNVVALRSAVVEAQADFYANDEGKRILMGETVTSLTERLRTAEVELDRIEGAIGDYQKAELQADVWLKTSEEYGIRFGTQPDTETLLRLFTELDVTGSMRSQDKLDDLVERYTKKDWKNRRITFPVVHWLKVTALSIDPLMSLGGGAANRWPTTGASENRCVELSKSGLGARSVTVSTVGVVRKCWRSPKNPGRSR